jgi:hypothetical protein
MTDVSHVPHHIHNMFENWKAEYEKTYAGDEHN